MYRMTEQDRQGIILLHKTMEEFCPGEAAQAMLQSLGKFLRIGMCTPDDAADIIKGIFDEEADKTVDNISQPATAWKSMFITPIFSDGDKLDSFVTKICTMMNLFTKWLN